MQGEDKNKMPDKVQRYLKSQDKNARVVVYNCGDPGYVSFAMNNMCNMIRWALLHSGWHLSREYIKICLAYKCGQVSTTQGDLGSLRTLNGLTAS